MLIVYKRVSSLVSNKILILNDYIASEYSDFQDRRVFSTGYIIHSQNSSTKLDLVLKKLFCSSLQKEYTEQYQTY